MSYYIIEIKGEPKKIINQDGYKKLKDSLKNPVIFVNNDIYDKFLFVRAKEIDYNIEGALLLLSDYGKRTFKADLLNYHGELNETTIGNMIEKAKKL